MPSHPVLECHFKLGNVGSNLLSTLSSMRHQLEDLAHSQVGQWSPYEVRLVLPVHLLQHPSAHQQLKAAGTWLSNQGWAWRVLSSTASCPSMRVLSRSSKQIDSNNISLQKR